VSPLESKVAVIRTTASLIAATALAGCGHDVYRRANTTDTQYIQDENACSNYAEAQPPIETSGPWENSLARARRA
jgi:hypothetical protein